METEAKKEYELAVLLLNEADEPKVTTLIGQDKISQKYGPKTLNLSYPIKKQSSAFFYVYQFTTQPEEAAALHQQLEQESYILRSLLITPPIKVSRRPQRQEEIEVKVEVKPTAPTPGISNEALEQALKEIL